MNLDTKRVLVTGATRGIGLAIAQKFSALGAKLAINGRDGVRLDNAAAKIEGAWPIKIVGDVTVPVEAERIVKEARDGLGGIDVIVCNVGSGRSVQPGSETPEEWQRVFALNLWSATNIVGAASDVLNNSCKSIVCVSSICGVEMIPGAPVTYSAAKAALNAFVKGISRPLGTAGVRINAVAPGNIIFDGSVWEKKILDNAKSVEEMLKRDVAMGRLGTSQEVADAVVWLSSDCARFVTGTVLVADGGQVRS